MESVGYPSVVLYLILLIGIPLALNKPFKAFILVAFMLSAGDANAFTFTRSELLGPYFNVNDACLLIALIALLPYIINRTKQLQFPKVTKWIIVVLLIGFVQSWFVMGWKYETLRALRWSLNLPIFFIIAATMVDNKSKLKLLLLVLFLGSVVSVVQHIIFVRSNIEMYELTGGDIGQFRTLTFRNPGLFFLLAGIDGLQSFSYD